MNVKRLLKTITEILESESQYRFQDKIGKIQTHFQQNQPDQLNLIKEEIFSSLENTPMQRYVGTDFKVLKAIEVFGYFDSALKDEINSILQSQSHEIQQKLSNFITKRDELLTKLRVLKKSLEDLNLVSDSEEIYELAVTLPEKYKDLAELKTVVSDFDRFLFDVSQPLNIKEKAYKVSSVSDGCIEIYIQVAIELAEKAVEFLDIVLRIQGAIVLCKQLKTGYESFSKKNKAASIKIADEELEIQKKKYIETFIKSLDIKGENKNDDENRIRAMFNRMVGYFEDGVAVEVRTPYIEEPRLESEDDDKETKKELAVARKKYQAKLHIDEVNRRLYLAQKEGLNLNLPEPNGESEKQENEQ